MRIVGEIAHPRMKITIFELNHRLSVQFELGMYTQIYKFRQGAGLEGAADVRRLVDAGFLSEVERQFARMREAGGRARGRFQAQSEEDEFDTIL